MFPVQAFRSAWIWLSDPSVMRPSRQFLVAAFALVLASSGSAHGDLHRRLAELTRSIAKAPQSPGLYLRRGELHRLHENWAAARRDLAKLRQLSPGFSDLDFYAGRLERGAGQLAASRRLLDRHLAAYPRHFRSRLCRARLLTAMVDRAALADYRVAVDLSPDNPDLYLERARVQTQFRRDSRRVIAGLDAGVKRLGPLVVLHQTALQIELTERDWIAALARLDRMLRAMPLRAPWLLRRGMVLERLSDPVAARRAYREGLAELAGLPRRNKIQQGLQRALNTRLRRLARSPATNLPKRRTKR